MAELIITERSNIVALANAVRNKTGQTKELTFGEILDTFENTEVAKNQDITIKENGTYTPDDGYTGFGTVKVEVEGSGGGDIPDASTAEFGRVKDVEPTPNGKAYYNGVLLPEIPADVLAQYPYAWIRNNGQTGYYDLLFAKEIWYCSATDTLSHNDSNNVEWYRIKKTTAESATEWTFNQSMASNAWGDEANRVCIWSNHDIPNGSATATEIYFEGTEPIKEIISGYGDYVDGAEKYAVTIETFNEIAHRIQLHHSNYDLVNGAEMFGFLSRSDFYEKGYANSTLELNFESSASGSLS